MNKQSRLSLLILSILQTSDNWTTRRQIGVALHRPKGITNPHDNSVLERLAASGEIEIRERAIGAAKVVFEYKVKR